MSEHWQAIIMFAITFVSVPSALALLDYANKGEGRYCRLAKAAGWLWIIAIFVMWSLGTHERR